MSKSSNAAAGLKTWMINPRSSGILEPIFPEDTESYKDLPSKTKQFLAQKDFQKLPA